MTLTTFSGREVGAVRSVRFFDHINRQASTTWRQRLSTDGRPSRQHARSSSQSAVHLQRRLSVDAVAILLLVTVLANVVRRNCHRVNPTEV